MKNIIFCFIGLMILLPGCGTDSGNPSAIPNFDGVTASPVCLKLNSCFVGVPANCSDLLAVAPNYTTALGLDPMVYPDLTSAVQGLKDGNLSIDNAKEDVCNAAIGNLSCASTEVTNAYSASSPNDFSNAYHLLSADVACQQMIY